jgi:hypothetical protein
MWENARVFDSVHFPDVEFDIAINFLCLACQLPDLGVLGIVGQDGQFIAPQYRPKPEVESLARKIIISILGTEEIRCISNVDETGGYCDVAPSGVQLHEVVIIYYTREKYLVLYWG